MGEPHKIAIIGCGTIGLSFAALHLSKDAKCIVVLFDSRPDLKDYVASTIPGYLTDDDRQQCLARLSFAESLQIAVENATVVQEQGPENPDFKTKIWSEVERYASHEALLWSSTSGIPASIQSKDMRDKSRLLVVHPYNPPHVMPLLEVVRSLRTSDTVVERTLEFWRERGRSPVVVHKECTGFVANRLAFALLREACSLVSQGVVSVEGLDEVVQKSMGPRWTVAGPFKSYHAGGGQGGLEAFMDKIGGTIGDCWEASEKDFAEHDIKIGNSWQKHVCEQAQNAYGLIDIAERDQKTRKVLEAVE